MGFKLLEKKAGPTKRNVAIKVYEKATGHTVLLTLSSVVWTEFFKDYDGPIDVAIGEGEHANQILLLPGRDGFKVAAMKYAYMLRFPLPDEWPDYVAQADNLVFSKVEAFHREGLLVELPEWLTCKAAANARQDEIAAKRKVTALPVSEKFMGITVAEREQVFTALHKAAKENRSDCVNLTNKQLAQLAGLPPEAMLKAVRWLEKEKRIEVEDARVPGQPNTYVILGMK